MTPAYYIHLNGIVQGVGFRPYVFRLAQEMAIKGWIKNSSHGVYIHGEGEEIDNFYRKLIQEVPPLAKITTFECRETEYRGFTQFEIIESHDEGEADVLISPDIATCEECLTELSDPVNNRYQYPFINCTNCGPRYTIIKDVPYDRPKTTMADFPMCGNCFWEYKDPLNRRFHAQPVACPECGPFIQLLNSQGEKLPGWGIEQLKAGAIIAVKGLGGFHLVCDAKYPGVVKFLRQRKERGDKPFALMARNIDVIKKHLHLSSKEEEVIQSKAAPIVILERRTDSKDYFPKELAPNLHTLGVMLPYTPLHTLLLSSDFDFLVMTSANLSGRPLIYTNEEALQELKGIADYFLLHNRDIYHPCDDSVMQIIGGEPVFHRRGRGYVPLPQTLMVNISTPILGVGGELKNAFTLAAGKRAFTSQYIGDMDGYENYQRFLQELASFQKVVQIAPKKIAFDLHPNYQTTRFAQASPIPSKVQVQHHHAHLVSVLGEHGINSPTLGVICDGTGWGEDEKIWGFEFLYGDAFGFKRLAHLEYLPLPGGDAGTKHPLRIAYAYGKYLLEEKDWQDTERLWESLSSGERIILDQQLLKNINVFKTSSAGRLFDSVSALLGICTKVSYEGQAAIELESFATQWFSMEEPRDDFNDQPRYPLAWTEENGCLILRIRELYLGIVEDILSGKEKGYIAYHFHDSLARGIVDTVKKLQDMQKSENPVVNPLLSSVNSAESKARNFAESPVLNPQPIVLSGGVFQNKLLTERVLDLCAKSQIPVLRSRELPPGDGGLAFGQVLIANER